MMDPIIYPVFDVVQGRGLIPHIVLPENFREYVPDFYLHGRERTVEEYVVDLRRSLRSGIVLGDARLPKGTDIRLQWDEERGLTNISVGTQGGLDLNDRDVFQEHNLSTGNGIIAGCVAMKYVSELLMSSPLSLE